MAEWCSVYRFDGGNTQPPASVSNAVSASTSRVGLDSDRARCLRAPFSSCAPGTQSRRCVATGAAEIGAEIGC